MAQNLNINWQQVINGPITTFSSLYQNGKYDPYYIDLGRDPWDRLPMSSMDPKRGTGRTSDMLWQAASVKDEEEPVLVVVHNERMIQYCLDQLLGGWWGLRPRDFMSLQAFDKGGFRGYRLPEAVFIDHFVEELAYGDKMVYDALKEVQIAVQQSRRMPKFIRQP